MRDVKSKLYHIFCRHYFSVEAEGGFNFEDNFDKR